MSGSASPTKNNEAVTFDENARKTKVKRGKKANVSKETRENIMTNIKITQDFNFEKRKGASNERRELSNAS